MVLARHRHLAFWLAFLTGLWSSGGLAWAADQGPLTLPALIQEAQRANPDIVAARKRWEAAQHRIRLAKGLPAPRIGVKFEEIPKGTVKVNQATLMYQLIQSLPFPGKLAARQRVAVAEAQQAAAEYKRAEWDVTTALKSAYYDLFLLDRDLELQAQQVVWRQQLAGTAEARYATGEIPQAELLQAQSAALEASTQLVMLRHRRQAMAAHLNHFLNRPAHQPIGAPVPLRLRAVPLSPEALLVHAQELQPELLAFKYSAERAEAAWRLAKRELLPDLETMVELRDPAMGPIGPWDLTLGLVLPFWFWTKQHYGVKAALYDKDSAAAASQAMQNEIARRVHEHWHEAQGAYALASAAQERLIPLAQQAVESTLAGYQGGRAAFDEVLRALNALSEQQRAYYRNLVAVEQHVAMLEQAVGLPLRPETPGGES